MDATGLGHRSQLGTQLGLWSCLFRRHTLTQNNSLEPFPGNEFYNLIYDIQELSDMCLRRLRSVNDQILGSPGTVDARVEVFANKVLDMIDPGFVPTTDADLDFTKWGSWGNENRAATATR